jgi:hydroxypyruvate isomerase
MPKFAANLSMLFTELPFLDRFEAAAAAGFEGVEYLFPYEFEVDALASRLRRFGLEQVLHNLPAGDWANGERGIACLPGREEEFRDGIDRAVRYATALGCRQVNCLAGIAPEGTDRRLLQAILVDNLRYAGARLGEAGIRLLIEPINTRDIPRFFLRTTRQARVLIEDGPIDNLQIQYDVYHMQIMEGDLARTIAANLDLIGHIQIADNPGRHEPGTGEINYPFLFGHLDAIGYRGWVGCEYKPKAATLDGLGWLPSRRPARKAVA